MNFLYYFSYNDENLALNDFNDFHMITLIKIFSKKDKNNSSFLCFTPFDSIIFYLKVYLQFSSNISSIFFHSIYFSFFHNNKLSIIMYS